MCLNTETNTQYCVRMDTYTTLICVRVNTNTTLCAWQSSKQYPRNPVNVVNGGEENSRSPFSVWEKSIRKCMMSYPFITTKKTCFYHTSNRDPSQRGANTSGIYCWERFGSFQNESFVLV